MSQIKWTFHFNSIVFFEIDKKNERERKRERKIKKNELNK